ncbi:hypothetical protein IQ22_00859 [Pseudomonas duriflava]|uniref:Uncharacterized protein n=1 Tax=Pseudomonas duriflava TaxID=459528 RepID=A0A562QLK8_9PSED|nr:hypothetical protein [Pseudomonas duriflava]TWI57642.1 hypothetical protein IQ22_00859 [Pseudomonas duriflava]
MNVLHSASTTGRFVPREKHVFWEERICGLLDVIASHHGFNLLSLCAREAYRLKGFLDTLEQSQYPELAEWDERIFSFTRLSCRLELEKYMLTGIAKC